MKTMEPKTTLKPEAQLRQEQSAEECCAPECGPDTCGGANTPVSVNTLVKARLRLNPDGTFIALRVQVGSGCCCDPDCGPDTCGA